MHGEKITSDQRPLPLFRNLLGRGDKSPEADGDGGDCDEAQEIVEKFVVAGGDASELFEGVEEPFDGVALVVERLVVGMLMLAMTPWRDERFGAGVRDGIHQAVGVMGSIGEHGAGLDSVNQIERLDPFGWDHVVFLARTSQQAAGIA
jgi:hypothetical protein